MLQAHIDFTSLFGLAFGGGFQAKPKSQRKGVKGWECFLWKQFFAQCKLHIKLRGAFSGSIVELSLKITPLPSIMWAPFHFIPFGSSLPRLFRTRLSTPETARR